MESKYDDQNTLDQAWSMMHTTLEKEMPVQKRRRVIWWLPVGIALLVLSGMAYIFSIAYAETEASPDQPIQHVVEGEPITSKEMKPTSIITNGTQNTNESEAISINRNDLLTKNKNISAQWSGKKNKVNAKKTATTKTKMPTPTNRIQPIITFNQADNSIGNKVPESKGDVDPINLSSKNQISNVQDNEIENDKSIAKSSDLAPSSILSAPKPLPLLESVKFDWASGPNIDQATIKIRKWTLGLKTAILSDVKFDSPTLLVEGQVNRKMGTRMSLVSGLGLKSQNLRFSLANANLSTDLLDLDVNGAGEFSFPNFGTESLVNQSKQTVTYSFNFLYFPIGLRYNVVGRWSIDGGIHYNFLELSSNSSNTSGVSLAGYSGNRESNEFVNSIRSFSNRNFHHLTYYLSTNYALGKKASLFVQYQGNTNRFPGENPKIDAHQFGAGMYWQF
jgi:hypothetical protein